MSIYITYKTLLVYSLLNCHLNILNNIMILLNVLFAYKKRSKLQNFANKKQFPFLYEPEYDQSITYFLPELQEITLV